MSLRFTLVFWIRVLLTVLIILAGALAIAAVKGGPTLPHDRLVRTGEAMDFTRTYRVEIDYQPEGGDLTRVAVVEVNMPEDFLVHLFVGDTIVDYLAVQNRIYSRTREFVIDDPQWSEPELRGVVMYPGLHPFFFPVTAIQAITAAFETREVGRERVEGVELVHFQGKVNPAYAYQRGYAVWLVKTKRARPIKEGSLGSSPPTLAWVQKYAPSLRNRIDTQEEALQYFTQHPASIDIWVHPKDKVAHLVEIRYPANAAGMGTPSGLVRFRFRDFNHDFDVSPFPRYPSVPEPTPRRRGK